MGALSEVTSGRSNVKVTVTDTKTAAVSALVKTLNIGSNNPNGDTINIKSDKVCLNNSEIQAKSFIDNYFHNREDINKAIQATKEKHTIENKQEEIHDKWSIALKEGHNGPTPYSERLKELEKLFETGKLDDKLSAERGNLFMKEFEYEKEHNPYNKQLIEMNQKVEENKAAFAGVFENAFSKLKDDYVHKEAFLAPSGKNTTYPNMEGMEGWKVHISISDYKEYVYCVEKVLPDLESKELTHKIVDYKILNHLNSTSQQGKGITIYTQNICDLNKLSEPVKQFLSIDNSLNVLTDAHLGGRVYARYTGYSNDKVVNPQNGGMERIPREEGLYKPEWIIEPPKLDGIFNNTVSNEKYEAQNSRELEKSINDRIDKEMAIEDAAEYQRYLESKNR